MHGAGSTYNGAERVQGTLGISNLEPRAEIQNARYLRPCAVSSTRNNMKIYKYRDFSNPSEADFSHLEGAVHRHLVWCARADTLNDELEFIWTCDYAATPETLDLLAAIQVRENDRALADARNRAEEIISSGRLESIVEPAFTGMVEQCRATIGLSCFGTAADNEILWERYGGNGAGVCIEFQVPDKLLGTQIRRVQYLREKRLTVDQLLRALAGKSGAIKLVYDVALLSKTTCWASEGELRFVSRGHSISVAVDRAHVTCVVLGELLRTDVRERIQRIVAPAPVADRARTRSPPC
jgi:hypothetical protein